MITKTMPEKICYFISSFIEGRVLGAGLLVMLLKYADQKIEQKLMYRMRYCSGTTDKLTACKTGQTTQLTLRVGHSLSFIF